MVLRKVARCLIEGILTGMLIAFIDSLSKETKAVIRRKAKKRHAVSFNSRFDLNDLNLN